MDQFNNFILDRIEVDAYGVGTVLHGVNLFPQYFAIHDDTAVAFGEMLLGAVSKRALGLPGHVVLAGEVVHVEFTGFVGSADMFYRGVFRLRDGAAIFAWA